MKVDPRNYTGIDGVIDLKKYQFFAEQEEMRKIEASGGPPVVAQLLYRIRRGMQKNAPPEYKPYPDRPDDWFPSFDEWINETR